MFSPLNARIVDATDRGLIGTIYVGDHNTLLHTTCKLITFGHYIYIRVVLMVSARGCL